MASNKSRNGDVSNYFLEADEFVAPFPQSQLILSVKIQKLCVCTVCTCVYIFCLFVTEFKSELMCSNQ